MLVQGALVQIVRNIHEGERPETIGSLLRSAASRIGSLVWASIVYGFGVAIGLVLLVVPGLLAAARWSLMAPLIMLEDADAREARHASSSLVRGTTATVLGALVVAYLLELFLPELALAFGAIDLNGLAFFALGYVWSAIAAPYTAHVLTVIYYKLTDPARPIIHPDVVTWRSVWSDDR